MTNLPYKSRIGHSMAKQRWRQTARQTTIALVFCYGYSLYLDVFLLGAAQLARVTMCRAVQRLASRCNL